MSLALHPQCLKAIEMATDYNYDDASSSSSSFVQIIDRDHVMVRIKIRQARLLLLNMFRSYSHDNSRCGHQHEMPSRLPSSTMMMGWQKIMHPQYKI